MNNIEDRKKYDEYEMVDEYDFSNAVRGRFYQPKKVPTTLRIDNDILIFLKKQAGAQKIPYQTLINTLLRRYMQTGEISSTD